MEASRFRGNKKTYISGGFLLFRNRLSLIKVTFVHSTKIFSSFFFVTRYQRPPLQFYKVSMSVAKDHKNWPRASLVRQNT